MRVNDRYSRAALPPYRYIPGQAPHPVRDPRGHARGAPETSEQIDSARWRDCEPHLYAVDLFNAGYYWEAHEAWESLWRGAGRRSPTGVFLQGLIQVAAALLKHAMAEPVPARSLAVRGGEKLRGAGRVQLGVDGGELAREVDEFLEDGTRVAPRIRLDVSLRDT
jgi:predicted metal-dependent hydrolase